MAIVRRIRHKRLERWAHHTEANCTYAIVTDKAGAKYLQLDTYGSPTRKLKEKKSQSIRLSSDAVRELEAILDREF